MSWEDGGPLDPPERGDWEGAVEKARAAVVACYACGGQPCSSDEVDGLFCACGWSVSDDDLVRDWAEAHERDPHEV